MKAVYVSRVRLAAAVVLCHISQAQADVTVILGNTLSGTSAVSGNLTNNGTLAPGGIISATGNLTQSGTGNSLFDLRGGATPQIIIGGTATLDGSVDIHAPDAAGNYHFTLIQANSVATVGGFAILSDDPVFTIDGKDYSFQLIEDIRADSVGVYYLIPGYADHDQFFANISTASLNAAHTNSNTILQHLRVVHARGGAFDTAGIDITKPFQIASNETRGLLNPASQSANSNLWFKAIGAFGNVNAYHGASGYSSKTGGFIAGVDKPVYESAVLGIAGGYTQSRINGGGVADVYSPRISAYGAYDFGAVNLDATVGYANNRIEASRQTINLQESAHTEHEFSAALQGSKIVEHSGFNLMPNMGLRYVHLASEGYTEQGTLVNAIVERNGVDSLQPYVGASLSKEVSTSDGSTFSPDLHASYSYEALSVDRDLRYTTRGADGLANGVGAARNTVSLGVGVQTQLEEQLHGYANYDADLYMGRGHNQTVAAGVNYAF